MFNDPEVEAEKEAEKEKEEINDKKDSIIAYSGINSNISNGDKIDYKTIRSKINRSGGSDVTDNIDNNDDKNKNSKEDEITVSTSSTSLFDTPSPIVFEKGSEGK